ncbi:hypothetical protein KI387_036979, partial [Taxus chinensis]
STSPASCLPYHSRYGGDAVPAYGWHMGRGDPYIDLLLHHRAAYRLRGTGG